MAKLQDAKILPFAPRSQVEQTGGIGRHDTRLIIYIADLDQHLGGLFPTAAWEADAWMLQTTVLRVRLDDVRRGLAGLPHQPATGSIPKRLRLARARSRVVRLAGSMLTDLTVLVSLSATQRDRQRARASVLACRPALLRQLAYLRTELPLSAG